MAILDDTMGILGKVAPTIATMLGGPLAGTAVSALTQVLGLPSGSDKDSVLAAVANASPDQLLSIKQEDNRHAEAMAKLGLDAASLSAQDRDSARKREMAVGGRFTPALAMLVVAGFFVLVGFVIFSKNYSVDPTMATLVGGLLGYASAKADQVVSYYFGSSSGQDHATNLLSKAPPVT